MQTTTQRPTGITILAVIAGILGVLGLLGSFSYFGVYPIYGVIAVVLSIAYIAFAYGAWTLQPWAWMIGVAIAAIGVLLQILYLFLIPGYSIINVVIGVILPGIILYYLMTPEIKRAFGQSA